jgi:hypothetical protein
MQEGNRMKNYVTSLGIALSLALAHAAQAQVITPPVPTNIEVSDQALLLDTLSKTTFIQRVNTDGGAEPSTDCDRPTDIGRKAFVPYMADYIFYKK